MSPRCRAPVTALAALLLGASAVHAQQTDRLALDMAAAYRVQPAASPSSQPADAPPGAAAAPEPSGKLEAEPDHIPFGTAGSNWLTFGGAFAYDLGEDKDINLHVAYSHFLADELEFAVQISGWYFAQDADDTGGVSGQFFFRWHFWHAEDWDWSVYGEAGIGLLAGFDEVPNGGQEFNFLPRVSAGFTKQLWDDSPTRLQLGMGWHHISNGRYTGDVNNPSRDSVMIYAGIMIPF